jgi:hypothetical protein
VPVTFVQWIKTQIARTDQVGEFARGVVSIHGRKPDSRRKTALAWRRYLGQAGASQETIQAMYAAWDEHQKYLKSA